MLAVLLAFAGFVLVFRYARPFRGARRVKLALEILAMLSFLTAVLVFGGGLEPAHEFIFAADRDGRAHAR